LETQTKKLIGFKEKPTYKYEVSMGVYMVNKKVLDLIPEDTSYGFDNLMLEMIKSKLDIAVLPHKGYWLDIGRPDDYEQACNDYDTKLIEI
jgi:NDP-sugar pyrophosphorylase family protein